MMILKRIIDVSVSLTILLIMLPLMIIIGIIVISTSKGPIFFIQKRIGINGKIFKIFKYRSMNKIQETNLDYYKKDLLPWQKKEIDDFKKIKIKDIRITKIGKILRRFSLDEIPQFINVLMGDMSLVGPRPYMLDEQEELKDSADIILSVKPGLTGLWQVLGRSDLTFKRRLALEKFYVSHWSISFDFLILCKTPKAIITGKGTY